MTEDKLIIGKITKDKQEKIDKDSINIMEEFPIEDLITKKNKEIKINGEKKPRKGMSSCAIKISEFLNKKQQKSTKIIKEMEKKEPKNITPPTIQQAAQQAAQQPTTQISSMPKIPKQKKKKDFNKLIIPLVLIIAILVVAFVITFKCDCPEGTDSYAKAKVEATGVLMNSIQNQIIQKGYAEIFNGDLVLKLAPYSG